MAVVRRCAQYSPCRDQTVDSLGFQQHSSVFGSATYNHISGLGSFHVLPVAGGLAGRAPACVSEQHLSSDVDISALLPRPMIYQGPSWLAGFLPHTNDHTNRLRNCQDAREFKCHVSFEQYPVLKANCKVFGRTGDVVAGKYNFAVSVLMHDARLQASNWTQSPCRRFGNLLEK